MSFLGIVPLGVYVVLHVWTNLSSLGGPVAFQEALHQSRRHPAFILLEILLGVAILIHFIVGLRLILRWRPNSIRVPTFSNLQFTLQRLSGLGLALFLVAHVINARLIPAFDGRGMESFCGMRHVFYHDKLTLPVYLLGLLGISFHLANGFWTFCLTWGLTRTVKAQRLMRFFSAGLFLALLTLSGVAVYGFMQPWHNTWGVEASVCAPVIHH